MGDDANIGFRNIYQYCQFAFALHARSTINRHGDREIPQTLSYVYGRGLKAVESFSFHKTRSEQSVTIKSASTRIDEPAAGPFITGPGASSARALLHVPPHTLMDVDVDVVVDVIAGGIVFLRNHRLSPRGKRRINSALISPAKLALPLFSPSFRNRVICHPPAQASAVPGLNRKSGRQKNRASQTDTRVCERALADKCVYNYTCAFICICKLCVKACCPRAAPHSGSCYHWEQWCRDVTRDGVKSVPTTPRPRLPRPLPWAESHCRLPCMHAHTYTKMHNKKKVCLAVLESVRRAGSRVQGRNFGVRLRRRVRKVH